ncbi:MAG: DNA primase [Candidatus Limnocylindria bacterium]
MPSGTVAEVKTRLGVAEVVGETVALKRAGASLKGLCPFHAEKTPSFIVTPERESWHCFGCGEGGDIFSFVMKRDGLDFREALATLAQRAGVELSERTARDDRRKRHLRDALETAIGFYREVLVQSRVAEPARRYLAERGLSDETLERFTIGFAPDDWQGLVRRLSTRGFTEVELVAAGLATRSERTAGVYDRFRGRIIFPIRDQAGGPIGLGGRLLPGVHGPKYLNSPATPLFDKSRVLYGIHLAKAAIRREKLAVIVEGYTDVMAAHQAGTGNVVASLGTALTSGQIALATRYAEAVALAYDVDLAGEAATERGLLEELGPDQSVAKVRVVRIPAGKDPDELIRADREAWSRAVAEAKPVIEYFIDREAASADLKSVEGRRDVTRRVLNVLRRVDDPIVRTGYLQQLARLVNVEERDLRDALRRERPARAAVAIEPSGRPVRPVPAISALDRRAVQLALRHPAVAADADVAETLPLRDSTARALLSAWRAWREAGNAADDLQTFVESLDSATGELARDVLAASLSAGPGIELTPDEARDAFRTCLLRLRGERIEEAIRNGRLLLDEAVRDGDADRVHEIEQRIDRLGREKADVTRAITEPPRLATARTA